MRVQAPFTVDAAPLQKQSASRTLEVRPSESFSIPNVTPGAQSEPCTTCQLVPSNDAVPPNSIILGRPAGNSPQQASTAYRQAGELSKGSFMDGMAKYKEDQLLRSPGGDAYDLAAKTVAPDLDEQRSFMRRIGKDLSDFWDNCKGFVKNLTFGSEECYRDPTGQIKATHKKGLLETLTDFVKNTASGLSLGLWTPSGETAPSGIQERLLHFVRKTRDAFLGDLMQGVPSSFNRMGKNLVLAGWNLTEVLPDTILGQFDAGRKLTTTIFDNGQVVVEYLSDVIPSGDAWMRVHAGSWSGLKLPIVYNLTQPEHALEDARWETVRNTPFRKTIETIGVLLADAAAIGFIGHTLSGGRRRESG